MMGDAGDYGADDGIAIGARQGPWPEAPESRPLIKPGEYTAYVLGYDIIPFYQFDNKRKLVLKMKVFLEESDSEKYVVLSRFLNWYKLPPHGSDLYKEWVKANKGKAPVRKDRMSPKIFVGKLFKVRVATVDEDCDRDPLVGDLRYSRIAKILSLL